MTDDLKDVIRKAIIDGVKQAFDGINIESCIKDGIVKAFPYPEIIGCNIADGCKEAIIEIKRRSGK
jgi:hypothetical protein